MNQSVLKDKMLTRTKRLFLYLFIMKCVVLQSQYPDYDFT